LNSTPPSFFFHLSPIDVKISTGLIFPFSFTNAQYFHYIHLLHPFVISSPTPLTSPQAGTILPF
jgi:hypothetical protein